MEILGVELSNSELEINYVDGTKEEIENGVYERKNAANDTVEERTATEVDIARLTLLANNFVAALAPIDATVVEVERERGKIEVKYADRSSEEVENGVYERKNSADQKVLERPATDADIARIEALTVGARIDGDGGLNPTGGDSTSTDDSPSADGAPSINNGPSVDDGPTAAPDNRIEISGDDNRDKLRGSNDDERLFGGGDRDDIRAKGGDDLVDGGSGNDRIRGDDGADELIGGDGNDRIRGGNDDDTLDGGAGNDRLRGDRGDDLASGGDGNDRVFGGGGDDTLSGDDGNDRVKGNSGDDIVLGGGGNDRVIGGGGSDTLDGGAGSDRYHGGFGADTLIFSADGVSDKINNFQDGLDLIDVSAFAIADIDAIIGTGRQIGEDLILDFGGGDTIIIEDTQLSQVGADDFIL